MSDTEDLVVEENENVVSTIEELIKIITSDKFDKLNNHRLKSTVPSKCLDEPCILGVDEAGRGPVLGHFVWVRFGKRAKLFPGPMVYSVFYCPVKDVEVLKEIGCTDSKTLTEKKREDIFELINKHKETVGWEVDILSPNLITNNMLKRVKCSLNEIAQNSTVSLIESILKKKVNLKEIYVDTIGPSDKYQAKLSSLFPQCKVVVEKKADLLYPIVGAASICAKVIRDNVVQHWIFPETITLSDTDFGTGYPGDPKSKKFLQENKDEIFGFPNLVRFSWSTAAKLLENFTAVEWEDENEKNNGGKTESISSYFKSLSEGVKHETNCIFFKERSLNSLDSF